jgi:DNA-binding CsgD family transcriptional regulator
MTRRKHNSPHTRKHNLNPAEIMALREARYSYSSIGDFFGVSRQAVYAAVRPIFAAVPHNGHRILTETEYKRIVGTLKNTEIK